MYVLVVIVVSVVITYLLKTLDILFAFKRRGIHISISNAFMALILLSKNQCQLVYQCLRNKKYKDLREVIRMYLLHFDLVVALFTAIVYETENALQEEKLPIIPVKKGTPLVDIMRDVLPVFNEQRSCITV